MTKKNTAKKTTDEVRADIEIMKYLTYDGPRTFGEIKAHLEKIGIKYANNKGLAKRLKSLRNSGKIVREKRKGDSYPVYQIMANSDFTVKYDGFFLRDQISYDLHNDTYAFNVDFENLIKTRKYSNDEYGDFQQRCDELIKRSIFRFGFQVLYSILVSQRRVKSRQGWEDLKLELWLKHALSFEEAVPSARFSRQLYGHMISLFSDRRETPFDERLQILEKSLKKLCTESYDVAYQAEETIDSGQLDDIKKMYANDKGSINLK